MWYAEAAQTLCFDSQRKYVSSLNPFLPFPTHPSPLYLIDSGIQGTRNMHNIRANKFVSCMCKSICCCVLVCVSIGKKCVFDYRAKPRHRVLAKAAESLATNLIDSSKRAATIIPICQRNITTPNIIFSLVSIFDQNLVMSAICCNYTGKVFHSHWTSC